MAKCGTLNAIILAVLATVAIVFAVSVSSRLALAGSAADLKCTQNGGTVKDGKCVYPTIEAPIKPPAGEPAPENPDSKPEPEMPACTPDAKRKCFEGNVYSFDSCGNRGDVWSECGPHSTCRVIEGAAKCLCEEGYEKKEGTCVSAENMQATKRCDGNTLFWYGDRGTQGNAIALCDAENMICAETGCACVAGYDMQSGICWKTEVANSGKEAVAGATNNCPAGMAFIPAGSFTMGCSPGDTACDDTEKPAKQVTLSKSFCMDIHEYQENDSDLPKVRLNWGDAKRLCEAQGKRLPTEAEWEYAARAGTTTKYYWGDTMDGDYAWYNENSENYLHPVGQKRANAYGLHDMVGNASEWVEDCYNGKWYDVMPERDPLNTNTDCGHRVRYWVLRGGSSNSDATRVRVSGRDYNTWIAKRGEGRNLGFRCAKDF